jgi:hypothetical protein
MINTTNFSFAVLPRAARAALQWRLLLLWAGCLLVPTLVLALPMWQMLGAGLDHSVHAAKLAQELDLATINDLLGMHGKRSEAFSIAGLFAIVLTLLISPLLSGFVATAARAPSTARFGELVAGGVREYPRMLRMLVWAAIPLGVALGIGSAAMDAADKYGAKAILASDAETAGLAALLLTALLFALAHATIDAGRAALAIERRRTSAFKAWWAGCKMLLRRPFATIGVYLLISIAGLALAALLGLARLHLPYMGVASFIGGIVLTLLLVMAIGWMRSARLFAMIELARSLRPILS